MAKGTSAIDPSNYASLGLTHVQCKCRTSHSCSILAVIVLTQAIFQSHLIHGHR